MRQQQVAQSARAAMNTKEKKEAEMQTDLFVG